MWKYSIHLVFLIISYTIVPGYSHVVFNRVFFGCIGDEETLQMRCRVNDLGLGAYIFHRSKELAQCNVFPNNSCFSITGNINITSSSDVVYTIDSRQRQILNGSWTCRNGAGEKNENSSLEVFSTKCETSSPLSNCGSSSRPSNCLMEKDNTTAVILLLVLPLVVFSTTVIILICCKSSGQNAQNEYGDNITDLLLVKVSYLWVCGNRENMNNRKRKIGCKSVWCFFLFGVYLAVVAVFHYSKMSADIQIGLRVFATFLGIFVAIFIPVIWQSRGRIGDIVDRPGDGRTPQEMTASFLNIHIDQGNIEDTVFGDGESQGCTEAGNIEDTVFGDGESQGCTEAETDAAPVETTSMLQSPETDAAPVETTSMLQSPGNKTGRKMQILQPRQDIHGHAHKYKTTPL